MTSGRQYGPDPIGYALAYRRFDDQCVALYRGLEARCQDEVTALARQRDKSKRGGSNPTPEAIEKFNAAKAEAEARRNREQGRLSKEWRTKRLELAVAWNMPAPGLGTLADLSNERP